MAGNTHRTFQTDMLVTCASRPHLAGADSGSGAVPWLKTTVESIIDNLTALKTEYGTEVPDLGTMLGIVIVGLTVGRGVTGA